MLSARHCATLLRSRCSEITALPQLRHFSQTRVASCRRPCKVGDHVGDIDTPALVVNLDKLEENVARMKRAMTKYPNVALRPHAKTHKSPDIARMQVKAGAVGVCCQTVTEAEAMVGSGVSDVLISNEVVGRNKLYRVASLVKQANVSVCVDNAINAQDLSDIAKEMDVTVPVVIEVDVGGKRCGLEAGEPVATLAKVVKSLPALSLKGIHCYNGSVLWNLWAVVTSMSEHMRIAALLLALKSAGIECDYVTGGGTGTYHLEAGSKVYTEVQPGSYTMMDADYSRNLAQDGEFVSEFLQSMFVLATVQSAAADGKQVVVDAGMKAVSLDSGVPVISEHEELTYNSGGDNHGILRPGGGLTLGSKVWLIPGHCDPTINMHDWIIGLRDGRVECLWPVSGRGPGY